MDAFKQNFEWIFNSFYFECNSSVFEYGVERFASYFREPLFDEKMVEKTVKVILNKFSLYRFDH